MYKRFGALSSSEDPEKLAKTVSGILMFVGGVSAYFGVVGAADHFNQLAQQASQLVTLGFAFFGIAQTAFGICRKILIAVHDAWVARQA